MKGVQLGISNWTKHVTSYYLKKLKADSGQTKLTMKSIQLDSSDKSSFSQSRPLDSVLVKRLCYAQMIKFQNVLHKVKVLKDSFLKQPVIHVNHA